MVFWFRADGQGQICLSDKMYKQACDLGLGIPSVAWSDSDVLDFVKDPGAFTKKYARSVA